MTVKVLSLKLDCVSNHLVETRQDSVETLSILSSMVFKHIKIRFFCQFRRCKMISKTFLKHSCDSLAQHRSLGDLVGSELFAKRLVIFGCLLRTSPSDLISRCVIKIPIILTTRFDNSTGLLDDSFKQFISDFNT